MSGVRVVPEDLQVSAAVVDAHANTVRVQHATADARIESAQKGLPAGSGAALAAAAAKWQADSTTMVGRLIDHSGGLSCGAGAYVATDQDGGEVVKAAGNRISPKDMGL